MPRLTAFLVLALASTAAMAQLPEPLKLQRLSAEITVDGVPGEAAWQQVDPLPLTMYYPTFRGTPEQRTEIRVAYDDDYLYAAGWFYDTDPDGIRINSLYRDRWNGDDAFALYLDSFNDNQNAKWFGVTPSGMRFDLLVSDDGASLNGSWDSYWDAEARVTQEGWFLEMRVPFSTIGFQVGPDGQAIMGLTVTRLVSRTGERVTFPEIDPAFAFRQPSVARDVSLQGVTSSRPFYLTPFASTGVERRPVLNNAGDAYEGDYDQTTKAGVDLRYALSGNLTLDVTANTDFAQVEADDQQVNLDRFSLFFPEKRRFFQEGSGLFDFSTGGGGRLFHSRRIGLNDAGQEVPVIVGGRLVGRVGSWDVGLLEMQTDASGETPRENFGVVRLRHQAFNANSFVGGILTSRIREDRTSLAGGLDAYVRLFGDDYLSGNWSATHRTDATASLMASSNLALKWQRRSSRGLAYTVDLVRSGRAYTPELGFARRQDFSQANFLANWYFFTDDHPRFRRVWPGGLAFSTFRNEDGSLESGQYAVWVQWEGKAGGGGWLEPKLFVEDVRTPFTIGGQVDIPAGRHVYADFQVAASMANGRKLRTSLDARAGTFFDGRRAQVIVEPTWNVSPHLELGAAYQLSSLRFPDRDQEVDIHLLRLRVRTALDSRASGNAFVQFNSTTDRLELNLRLRYNFAEGQDLWLVYNEGVQTDPRDPSAVPALPRSEARSVILKYTHTLGR